VAAVKINHARKEFNASISVAKRKITTILLMIQYKEYAKIVASASPIDTRKTEMSNFALVFDTFRMNLTVASLKPCQRISAP
jgi:hypothetical protein